MRLKNYTISQIATKKIITVSPEVTLLEAREILLRYKIRRLVVVNKRNIPVGIITEKDVAKKFFLLGSKAVDSVKVNDFMTRDLITLNPENSVHNCASLMRTRKISSIIIVNKDKTLAGLITKTDLISIFLTKSVEDVKVSEVMNKKVITVKPSDSILLAESLLIRNRISRIIVERKKTPVGIITFRDFIPAKLPNWISEFADPAEVKQYKEKRNIGEFHANQMSYLLPFNAVDIMTSNPKTISPDEDVMDVVMLMIRHDISGLPVVKNSKLVGIITKTDIVNALE